MTATLTSRARTVPKPATPAPNMLQWMRLMVRTEKIHETYGLGLGNVWYAIHRQDFADAVAEVEKVEADIEAGLWAKNPCRRENCDSPLHEFFSDSGSSSGS